MVSEEPSAVRAQTPRGEGFWGYGLGGLGFRV